MGVHTASAKSPVFMSMTERARYGQFIDELSRRAADSIEDRAELRLENVLDSIGCTDPAVRREIMVRSKA